MAAEERPEGAAGGSAGGGGTNKLVVIFTVVNLCATLGIVAALFISFQKEKSRTTVTDIAAHSEDQGGSEDPGSASDGTPGTHGGKAPPKAKGPEYGKMVPLEQFTVNLSTPGSATPKFVRVNISLELPSKDSEAEVTQKMPQVRNTIIDLFNSKRPADLATSEGRDYVKEEIRNALNSFMVSGKVKGVFFTDFALSS